MRLTRLVASLVVAVAIAGCGKDNVTNPSLPPLAGVRFINSVNDTSALDFRAIDQIQFSPVGNAIAYRGATEFQPTEAKARHFRVFVTSTNPAITSHPIVDTTVTFAANTNYTMLLTGSARGTVQFAVITESGPTPAAGQIAVRTANNSAGAIDNYLVDSVTTAVSGTPTMANVAPGGISQYVALSSGKIAARVTPAGSATVSASQQGPRAPATLPGERPAAGVDAGGTAFTVVYFPAGVAGSPTAPATGTNRCSGTAPLATCNPTVVWFVDRLPTP
jgi:hypothetical protein